MYTPSRLSVPDAPATSRRGHRRAHGHAGSSRGPGVAREAAATYVAGPVVTREAAAPSVAGPGVSVAEGLGALAGAVDVLADTELATEGDLGLLDRVAQLDRQAARLDAQRTRLLAEVERRHAYRQVGAVTLASWYRGATNVHPGRASARATTAKRLRHFDQLTRAYRAGDVTEGHVEVVTRAAVPRRILALCEHEATLVRLATQASPKELAKAVALIRETVDPDAEDEPVAGHDDPRRYLYASPSYDGMVKVDGLLDQIPGELFLTLLHTLSAPAPAEEGQRDLRTPAQRRADAFSDLVTRAASTDGLPSVNRYPLHVLLRIDLDHLTGGTVDPAGPRPRLRYTGELHPRVARKLAQAATRFEPLLTLGPWRGVGVGRTQRTLPAWLRAPLEAIHTHCRGPHCDQPVPWGEVHHLVPYSHGGPTDLAWSLPLCGAHHDLLDHGWTVEADLDTGHTVWTSPTGHRTRVRPPP